MELINDILIQCDICKSVILIKKEYMDYETTSYERQMGAEIVYEIQEECACDNCGNTIQFRVSGYEYPEGCFNYEDYEIDAGIFIQEPNMQVTYYEEFDDATITHFLPLVEENIYRILEDKNYVYQLSPREFEEVVEEVFKQQGFQTTLTPQTRDGGKDIIAVKSILGKPFVAIVECKRYNEKNKIGVDIVRGLYGVQAAEKINKSILVTSSYFSKDAIKFASDQNTMMDLIDINELINLIKDSIRYEEIHIC